MQVSRKHERISTGQPGRGDIHGLILADGTWNFILWSAIALIVATVAVALVFHGERGISRIVAKNRAAVIRILSEGGRRMGRAIPGRGA